MKWRLVEEQPYTASMNMAIDHAIYESVANGREKPTIRFYKWQNPSVSIGAYQDWKEINLDACKKHRIDIVRRMTGGRAVFHDKTDFTYSVIAHIRVFNYSIEKAYKETCLCIINALSGLGIKADLENRNDVLVEGKKISGNAAKAMEKGVYLQHGTLAYNGNNKTATEVLNVPKELIEEKATSILKHKRLSHKRVYDELKQSFVFGKDHESGKISQYELIRAEELTRTKYNTIILAPDSFVKNKGACYVERG